MVVMDKEGIIGPNTHRSSRCTMQPHNGSYDASNVLVREETYVIPATQATVRARWTIGPNGRLVLHWTLEEKQ